jgi:hypothetical protein
MRNGTGLFFLLSVAFQIAAIAFYARSDVPLKSALARLATILAPRESAAEAEWGCVRFVGPPAPTPPLPPPAPRMKLGKIAGFYFALSMGSAVMSCVRKEADRWSVPFAGRAFYALSTVLLVMYTIVLLLPTRLFA